MRGKGENLFARGGRGRGLSYEGGNKSTGTVLDSEKKLPYKRRKHGETSQCGVGIRFCPEKVRCNIAAESGGKGRTPILN